MDLHVTNGDGAANLLKDSAIPGDVLPWRDPMHHGPFPTGNLDDVSKIRATYLAGDADPTGVLRDFELRNTHLRAYAKYSAVVLWFEHDLLDQLQILQILDWFADQDTPTLQMVCINAFPGIEPFRGLGQLTPQQIETLDPMRATITTQQMQLAKAAWAAFRSPDPSDLTMLVERDLSALPFLKAALRRHLQEYPWLQSGLTRSETQIMNLVRDGVTAPVEVFVQNMDLEDALFMGDWPTFGIIERLCTNGLLTCSPASFWYPPTNADDRPRFRAQQLQLTEIGQSILDGQDTAFAAMPRDEWLGGVHLDSTRPIWCWDAAAGRLRQRAP